MDRLYLSLGRMEIMGDPKGALKNPRAVGVACAIGAISLGIAYMAAAGAPAHYLGTNAAALIMGLASFGVITRARQQAAHMASGLMVVLGGALLATALFGVSAEGATRWVRVGPLSLQVSLIVLPIMLVLYAQRRDLAATAGIALAALALAVQPDRAMAGVLATSLAALAVARPDRWVFPALLIAVAGFCTALLRPDRLPAVPHVDQILYSAFEVHAAAGIAVLSGAFLLIVPAIIGGLNQASYRESYWVFGTVWLGIVVAAAVGNYPMPLVGYGGSAVLGYLLSLSFLPSAAPLGASIANGPLHTGQIQQNDGAHMCGEVVFSS